MNNRIQLSMIEKISCDCGIPIALEAAEVIRLIIELRSNEEIMDYMNKIYGHFRPLWMGNSQKGISKNPTNFI